METNTTNDHDRIIDEAVVIEDVEDIDVDTAEADASAETEATGERPHGRGRGRRGMRGGRPFGPNRPYRFALFVEEDGTFVLRSPDLAERTATIESLDGLGAAMQSAIDERSIEDAAAEAEAEKDAQFSGKFVLRLPRSMHRQLTELAEAEGVSLNQLALGFLAESMGRAEMIQEFGERRGGRREHRGGGRGPEGRGPRGGRGPEGRGPGGGHGPHGGRGPWNGPEGRSPQGPGAGGDDFGARGPRGFGHGPQGRGFGPRGGHRRSTTNPFAGADAAPEQEVANDQSFV